MTRAPLLLVAVLLAGCQTMTATPRDPGVPTPTPAGTCDAGPAQGLVGTRISDAVVETARRASGATLARTLRPETMTTMEFRADRLGVTVDAAGTITAIRCG